MERTIKILELNIKRKFLKKGKPIKLIIFIFIISFILLLLIQKTKNIIFNNISYNILNNLNNSKYNKIKVCLCTPAKEENRYIREFVQHYEKYGVDKIFIYDNNDIEGEKLDDILKDYISKGFVEILNWRGKKSGLYKLMNECYRNNFQKYDWLIFYEVDEYIHLFNYTNIKDFLNETKFEKCEVVHLNLVCHTDNNLLYYENKPLAKRFPEITPRTKLGGQKLEVKAIIRGHLPKVKIDNVHRGDSNLKRCNGYGHKKSYHVIHALEIDDKYYYIDHYYSKSTEEFIEKINKYDFLHSDIGYKLLRIDKYFSQSEITKDKLDLIEKRTGLNMTKYRRKIERKKSL